MVVLPLILTVFLLIFQSENVLTTEIQVDRIELVNTTYLEGIYNISELRISRINRTTYALTAQIITYVDLDENWECEVSFFRNRLNNNQYYKMPFKVPRTSACQALDQSYVKYLQPSVKDISNLPQFKEGDHICPVKKGTYWLKNFIASSSSLPFILPDAYWKAEALAYYKDKVIAANSYFRSVTSIFGIQ